MATTMTGPGADVAAAGGVDRIRVLLVDDHAVVRMGLRTFFDMQPDIEVVGEAADGSEGVALAGRHVPDVVLMDLLMPHMDGVTAIGRIKADRPETEIVTMTSFIEEAKVTAALEAGATGYVLKDAEAEEVAAAVRAAYRGEVHLDRAVARSLAERLRARKGSEPVEPSPSASATCSASWGRDEQQEIGAELFITERTARTYVSNILGKLGLQSRRPLWAVEHGWGSSRPGPRPAAPRPRRRPTHRRRGRQPPRPAAADPPPTDPPPHRRRTAPRRTDPADPAAASLPPQSPTKTAARRTAPQRLARDPSRRHLVDRSMHAATRGRQRAPGPPLARSCWTRSAARLRKPWRQSCSAYVDRQGASPMQRGR
jgi:DNA-binding NarL/FixJ family response regulator